ncbi:peptide-methionine (S)-S-oxide reductase MsrA [Altericroceibacterium endophyticum]|uniref:Peptide methionine sulfoxide reductase MsrA n=1 Tax=Altericroceibacterium endophyticum TaxID=1808508 RepID=A0A6I4T538_9SPHN|nr:peptide-methionine (S)-S-oxide reductase MsrA [Altericroceibacterium endophyticum]MXO65539.1 peptide-methionine (S)-S-oxide reductase MsrA [Altericroceibacterium endophyticum]
MRLPIPLLAAALALGACQNSAQAAENIKHAPAASIVIDEGKGLQTAIFAGGCFWGVEGVFSHMKGVKSAIAGYHGGSRANASYRAVSSGKTAHAEAVKVTYDPAVVRYDQLLRVFFSVIADPTLKDRQGPDVGSQYRAALIPLGADQRRVATAYLKQMERSGIWSRPIVTRIEAPRTFYKAESSHQDFMRLNPNNPYIRRWDRPKVDALHRLYPDLYQTRFVRD